VVNSEVTLPALVRTYQCNASLYTRKHLSLSLSHHGPFSDNALKFNLRRYTEADIMARVNGEVEAAAAAKKAKRAKVGRC